ncbi:hypothetical protein CAS74_004722 [Pichia kudriavzevii]|uniref:Alpha-1,3/1,6-mannosyltransferase ALG2 n=1 Tax=Pichia kudriavzevii TaxID=4909 RepID=A0A1V2LTC8_PICKU|nr:hypothetical protein BOH78_0537 [Pichia kudriavzevii]OUT20470.1 hypothetical protein CAS74_004722 [Pichia kudriavzevii]
MPKVAFIHPDLGIGGAERLIVDAALALKSKGHDVTLFTSHCDPKHCFEEVKDLDVEVYGDFLPTSFLNKFYIVFAFLRQLYLSIKLIITLQFYQYDIIILDQLSYCIPLLQIFSWNTKILFYCHFPDKLLASHKSLIRKIYRLLFDIVEDISTSYADEVVVNSKFTKSVVQREFKLVSGELKVVYPCVETDTRVFAPSKNALSFVDKTLGDRSFFLSINRFERKKNIKLALQAFAKYLEESKDKKQVLIIAGGFDNRVTENVEYFNELSQLCDSAGLEYVEIIQSEPPSTIAVTTNVIFIKNLATDLKNAFISKCDALLYTPTNEHFGIVPLEAMRLGKLVVADKSGGPLETIVDYAKSEEFTGFTVESETNKWEKTLELIKTFTNEQSEDISKRAIKRVDEMFSFNAMQTQLDTIVTQLVKKQTSHKLAHVVVPLISLVFAWFASKAVKT